MTIQPLRLNATVAARSDASQHIRLPGDAVLVQRGNPRWLVLMCPCGCGEVVPVNLDTRSGKAWEWYDDERNGMTVFPSVWRDTGCKSHFIIWYGQILLFDGHRDAGPALPLDLITPLIDKVTMQLSRKPIHFHEIARKINAVPWDVQYICRQLVDMGRALEGVGEARGFYTLI